jgi:uncharacterized DUF497 family protein
MNTIASLRQETRARQRYRSRVTPAARLYHPTDPAKCIYNLPVLIEFDPAKNERNIAARGLSFERAAEFDFSAARIWQDIRKPYPETRYVAVGYLGNAERVRRGCCILALGDLLRCKCSRYHQVLLRFAPRSSSQSQVHQSARTHSALPWQATACAVFRADRQRLARYQYAQGQST